MCLTNNKFVWCFILITTFVTITICADTAICISHFKNNTEKLISKNDSDQLNKYWPQLEKQVEISKQLRVSPDLEEIKNDLLLALNLAFPKNTIGIDLFGSRMTGVGNENSDIDIYVQLDKSPWRTPHNIAVEHIYKAADVLYRNFSETWVSVGTITKTLIPIICLIHKPTNIEVDVNFSDRFSSPNDDLLNYFFDLQPIARYMIHYLRRRTRCLELQQHLRSHHHSLMVVYFLQIKNLLPQVVTLSEEYGINVENKLKIKRLVANTQNTEYILKEYLKFYANFDYNKYAICPYYGTWITRAKLTHLIPKSFDFKIASFIKPIVIQDILRIYYNNARSIKLEHFTKFLSNTDLL